MGTRGFLGFVINDTEKITYNHWDSYPSCLGAAVLNFARSTDRDALPERVRALTLVNDQARPTPDQIEKLSRWADPSVGSQGINNTEVQTWYQLLRDAQGDPEAYLAAGFMPDNREFALDSLFCEWGYLVDLDAGTLEVYRGFQQEPPKRGRWAGRAGERDSSYAAVERVAVYPLNDLPKEADFMSQAEADEGDDQ